LTLNIDINDILNVNTSDVTLSNVPSSSYLILCDDVNINDIDIDVSNFLETTHVICANKVILTQRLIINTKLKVSF